MCSGGVFGQGASPGWNLWVQSLPVTTPSSRSFVREGHISKARILSEDLRGKGRRNEWCVPVSRHRACESAWGWLGIQGLTALPIWLVPGTWYAQPHCYELSVSGESERTQQERPMNLAGATPGLCLHR